MCLLYLPPSTGAHPLTSSTHAYSQVSGELLSGDTALSHLSQWRPNLFPLILPNIFNCCQVHWKPASVCKCMFGRGTRACVCVCVRLCWVEVQQGKGSLVSQFSALIGVNEWPFCCSAESLHPSPSLSSQHGGKMTHSHSSRHDIITGLMPVYEPGHTLMYTFSLKRDVFHKHRAEQ